MDGWASVGARLTVSQSITDDGCTCDEVRRGLGWCSWCAMREAGAREGMGVI